MQKPLKTVFLLPGLTAGGAERVLITLMNGLDRRYFAPVLIALSGNGPMAGLADKKIPVKILGRGRFFAALPGLYFALRREKPAVVVSTMAHMNFATLLLKPFFPYTRFIVREAITPSFILKKHRKIHGLLRYLYRLLYPRANCIIAPAQAIIDEFKSDLAIDTRTCAVLPNPVDSEKIRAIGTLPARRDAHVVQFVAAGRLAPQKGFDRLIESLPRLSHRNWRLTIYGEGPARPALEALVRRHGLQDAVALPGHTDEPWPMIAGADAFLMPSRFEGLPNAVLESLACGTPVIATAESGGIAEIKSKGLTVVSGMDEFIRAMESVRPAPAAACRPSLLPEIYEKEAVIKRFSAFLT